MRSLLPLAATITLLAGCARPTSERANEEFLVAFEKMQTDQRFLEARTLSNFQGILEFGDDSMASAVTKPIPCSVFEMHRAGWDVLSSSEELKDTDARYIVERNGDRRATVVLGVPEGVADARYYFEQHAGKWYLSRMEIYAASSPGSPQPSVPCKPAA